MARLALLLLALFLSPIYSAAAATVTAKHLSATLVAESENPAPGKPVSVALVIKPNPGWHIYWENPGAAGLAPELTWALPAGVTATALLHPFPTLAEVQGIVSNVHMGEVTLLTSLNIPANVRVGSQIDAKVGIDLLVCTDSQCVPETLMLGLSMTVGDGTTVSATADLFDKARAALPIPLKAAGRFNSTHKQVRLFLPLAASETIASAYAFVREEEVVGQEKVQGIEIADDGIIISMPAGDAPLGKSLSGDIRLERADKSAVVLAFTAESGSVPIGKTVTGTGNGGFLFALGGAILGGLLLNLMPCVFPILSLKALALAKAGGEDGQARSEAIGYTLGAVSTLLALGAIILALRSGGQSLGWAFQLQSPPVVAVLILLMTAIATNLAGLYEMPSPNLAMGNRGGIAGGFATGALAAFVATPCTGPFMAGALGAALLLPVPAALAVFAGLGLGLALPFLGLGFIPSLRRRLPKPGQWMVTFRQLLSLPMFATALGLCWVLGRQTNVTVMTIAIGAALLAGVSLWWRGLRQARGLSPAMAFVPMLGAVAIVLFAMPHTVSANNDKNEETSALSAQPYSAARLTELRQQRRSVFVYLTADWCLSCKVNEASSLSSDTVASAFQKANVAVLKGDWTRPNPEVSRLLAEQERAGIPLYLWYPKGGDPVELPQVLTPSMLAALTRS